MNTIVESLKRRYATKKFDENKILSEEDINTLLESLILSPSAFGLQPWKFIRVKDQDIRKKLQEASRGQPQITQASDLFVLATKINMQESDVEEYNSAKEEKNNVSAEKTVYLRGNYKKLMELFKDYDLREIEIKSNLFL